MSGESETPAGIAVAPVTAWMERNIEGARAPFRFELITGGRSNLTYRVDDAAGNELVLRRPPLGAVLATAHDMAREHRIISAVAKSNVPVAPALGVCEDESVNGAPFYIMRFVAGRVLSTAAHSEKLDLMERRRLGEHAIEILADLHAVDPDAIGLGDLGRKTGYVARQIKRWSKQWEDSKTRELPAMERLPGLLEARMPEQTETVIAHGDYRLGNLIVGPDARIAAVLDWELCTQGDPLADLAYALNDWGPASGKLGPSTVAEEGPSSIEGFPSREEFLERYQVRTGRDCRQIGYYRAFQAWRSACIAEGVLARYLKGVMGDEIDTFNYSIHIEQLAQAALELLEQSA